MWPGDTVMPNYVWIFVNTAQNRLWNCALHVYISQHGSHTRIELNRTTHLSLCLPGHCLDYCWLIVNRDLLERISVHPDAKIFHLENLFDNFVCKLWVILFKIYSVQIQGYMYMQVWLTQLMTKTSAKTKFSPVHEDVIKWKHCAGNSSVTDAFPSQRVGDTERWCFLWFAHEQTVE